MLAKCISTKCKKTYNCKRALSDSTAHVDYRLSPCNGNNNWKWHIESEPVLGEGEVDSDGKEDINEQQ